MKKGVREGRAFELEEGFQEEEVNFHVSVPTFLQLLVAIPIFLQVMFNTIFLITAPNLNSTAATWTNVSALFHPAEKNSINL